MEQGLVQDVKPGVENVEQDSPHGVDQDVEENREQGVEKNVEQGVDQNVKQNVKQDEEQGVEQNVEKSVEQDMVEDAKQSVEGAEEDIDTAILHAERELAELIEAQREEVQRLQKFLGEWPDKSLKFETLFVMYAKLKDTIEEDLNRLASMQKSISNGNTAHNSMQVQCKVQSLCGGALCLIGVLAAPVSGGLSLALTVGSAATHVHGMAKEYNSKQKFNATAAETMEESRNLQQEIAQCFRSISDVIMKMEQMVNKFSEVRRKILDMSLSETKGPNLGRFVFQVADSVYLPLKDVFDFFSGPTKATTKSLSAKNGDKLVKAAATTLQLANKKCKSAASTTGIAKLAQVKKISQSTSVASKVSVSSKVVKLSGNLAKNGKKGLHFGHTAKAAAITKSISKFNVALCAVSICTDVYSLATHKGPAQTSEEEDIQKLIDETESRLGCIDEFVNEANATYASITAIVEDINSDDEYILF